MHKIILACLFVLALVWGCSQQDGGMMLQKETPAYQLAQDLAKILPVLDPDSNTVLVAAKEFSISSGDVIQSFYADMGNRALQLKEMGAEQLKPIIDQYALQMAEKRLLIQAADQANIEISPQEVDNMIAEQYNRMGGEQAFLDMLKKADVDLEHFKSNMHKDLLIQKYLDGFMAENIQVTEEEIQAAYKVDKTASVRHILLLTQGKTEEEKAEIYKKMEGILQRVKAGEDFAALAKEFTEDPGSKETGGLYEDFARGAMVKPFEDAAFSVPVGEVSDIVETTYGYHILKIVDRKKETRPLEEARVELEEQIRQGKQRDVYDTHMVELRNQAELKVIEY